LTNKSRAFKIGFSDGLISGYKKVYIRPKKIKEYDDGYVNGQKEFMKTKIEKPQLFHNSISSHNKKRLTISILDDRIMDVVRENTDCQLVIHNYNIDGLNKETNIYCKKDEGGKWYQEVILE
jgi:hypothetical protein